MLPFDVSESRFSETSAQLHFYRSSAVFGSSIRKQVREWLNLDILLLGFQLFILLSRELRKSDYIFSHLRLTGPDFWLW